jgi:hypothetical protein
MPTMDEKLAMRSMLWLPDFPSGWTSRGGVTEGVGTPGFSGTSSRHLTACLGMRKITIDNHSPHWDGPTFSDGSSEVNVNDEVTIFPSRSQAASSYEAFVSTKAPGCLASLLRAPLEREVEQRLQPGQNVGEVTAAARALPPSGNRVGDVELVVPIVDSGNQVPVYVDLIVVLEGRAETTITASSPSTPFPASLGSALAGVAAARMAGADR